MHLAKKNMIILRYNLSMMSYLKILIEPNSSVNANTKDKHNLTLYTYQQSAFTHQPYCE